jgi:hypothetical protein
LATLRRAGDAPQPSLYGETPPAGVVFTYVDNSNVWIEGQRIQAVKRGLAHDVRDAMDRNVGAPWAYDFGRLYEPVCPPRAQVGRSILLGSRPPPNDSVWERAHAEGFEVEVFNRNVANKEKQVDTSIVTTMLDDSYQHMKPDRGDTAVLVAGDGDYVPSVKSIQKRCLHAWVVFWKHATSRELRETAHHFSEHDQCFDYLTWPELGRPPVG